MHYAKGVADLEGTLDPDPLGVEDVDEDMPDDLGADEIDIDDVVEDEDDVQVPGVKTIPGKYVTPDKHP